MGDEPKTVSIRPPLVAGGQVRAIIPNDFESAYRLARVIVEAKMAPASLDTPEKACVAIMHGLEVGLTPMAALQSIAVINGMPTIYGDGMLALVRNSGLLEDIIENVEIDEKGEPTIATCKVKRRGQSQWVIGTFTRVEAQRAGLWNKAGPWQGYKQRMMQMRARSWVLRDTFTDVLRGLHMAEEILDMTPHGSATTTPPPEPRRSDPPPPPIPGRRYFDPPPAADRASPPAAAVSTADLAVSPLSDSTAGEAAQAPSDVVPAKTHARGAWAVPDNVIGQKAVLEELYLLLENSASGDDVDAIEKDNAERIAKLTGMPRSTWDGRVRARRELLDRPL